MVQDIKELCPKLYIEGFGDALDAIILVQRHVQVQHTRPHSDITPSVTQPVHRVRNREASGVDVVIWVARVNGMIASGQREPIRVVVCKTRYERAERVAPNQGREWQAGGNLEDLAQLPAPRQPVDCRRLRFRRGNLPQGVSHKIVADVEVR